MSSETTYTNNGDGTSTITIAITADTDKVLLLSPEASEYFYYARSQWQLHDGNGDLIPWDDLTNDQKLHILGQETQYHLKNGAYQYYYDSEIQTTKDGLDDIDDRYDG